MSNDFYCMWHLWLRCLFETTFSWTQVINPRVTHNVGNYFSYFLMPCFMSYVLLQCSIFVIPLSPCPLLGRWWDIGTRWTFLPFPGMAETSNVCQCFINGPALHLSPWSQIKFAPRLAMALRYEVVIEAQVVATSCFFKDSILTGGSWLYFAGSATFLYKGQQSCTTTSSGVALLSVAQPELLFYFRCWFPLPVINSALLFSLLPTYGARSPYSIFR